MKKNITLSLDKHVFFISISLIVLLVIFLFAFPEGTTEIMVSAKNFMVNNLGFVYTWSGILSVVAVCFFSFSHYGKIKLGDADDKPEYSNLTWASTLFTAGIAAAILYWSPIEWTYYYETPALGIEPLTWEAAEWSQAFTFFHWGIIPWSLYAIGAIPIAYCYYVRKKPVLKVSETCRDLLGKHTDGPIGKLFDICFIIAMVMGATTEIGTAVPYISTAICTLLGIEVHTSTMILVLFATTVLFSVAAFFGLKKGICKLGDTTAFACIGILLFVFIFGPTIFIIKISTTSMGIFTQNFIRMMTWMDPIMNGGFEETWTQFYWAWWMSASLFMAMFIARLSRGRTVRNVLLGSVCYGSLGCGLFFWIFGGFTMNLQFSGEYDLISAIKNIGSNAAIMEALKHLPLGNIVILICAFCGIMLLATTYDASTTSIAAISQLRLKQGEDPNRLLTLFWSCLMVLVPAGIIVANGPFAALQAATIVGSFPVPFILIVEMLTFVKMVKADSNRCTVATEIKITRIDTNKSNNDETDIQKSKVC